MLRHSLLCLLLCFTRMSSRCLWDADTDNYAEDVFMNVSAFALVITMWGVKNKNQKKTPERQFFVLQLIVPIVTSAGQLVLCGGCFRKLLLLKTKGGMKQYSFRWKDLKWKSKGYCSRSAFRGTGCVNLKQLCDFCISRSTQMTSSVEIPQNMTDFLCHQTRCQSEVGTLSVSSTL